MTFIEDVKRCWKMLSMQAMAAGLALQGTYMQLPDDLKAAIPHQYVSWATMALLVTGMVGRLVNQTPQDKP